jgi:cobalt-zinc-cadmium efflux system protein
MSDHHHHHDHHDHSGMSITRSFVIGIVLNLLFVLIEVVAGFRIHSLSLLSDAGHNLTDVASLALSLLAFRLEKIKATDKYTYGYKKTTILVALLNSTVLLISIGAIGYEAIHSLAHPRSLPGLTISVVAFVGILINGSTALIFFRSKKQDLNVKGAYLHLLSDAVVSLGLVVAGILMYYTGWNWLDAAFGLLIALFIVTSTWLLLNQSLRLTLDGVPAGVSMEEIRETALKIDGIKDIHHIHVWAMSTSENAFTAHVVFDRSCQFPDIDRIKAKLKHELHHLDIHHITLETETEDSACEDFHH